MCLWLDLVETKHMYAKPQVKASDGPINKYSAISQ